MRKISIVLALLLCLSLCGCVQTVTATVMKNGGVLPEAITDSKSYVPETVPFVNGILGSFFREEAEGIRK